MPRSSVLVRHLAAGGLIWAAIAGTAQAQALIETLIETPSLEPLVEAGTLPPVPERLPGVPSVVTLARPYQSPGQHGGDLTTLMARAKDTRIIYVYAYARLVAYTPELDLVPDLVERVDVEKGRTFTFHLRPGHRWSDGHPFTSADFKYWWEDKANDPNLSPFGPPAEYTVDGELPTVTFPDELTVRYSWSQPNPYFLPLLAGARPIEIYMPAHYLGQLHERHADPAALAAKVEAAGVRGWAQLHNRSDDINRLDNPEMPTLQPWNNTTAAPSQRFVFVRNPYYHRVDENGRQLPYIDRIIMSVADSKIIPAKVGAGESDLQARYLRFDNYTFLKEAESRNNYLVHLWRTGIGSEMALYPNMSAKDPVWRALNRDVRFRRALSLGIHREEINQVIYYGLARASNNTVLPDSPLYEERFQTEWADYDLGRANALLDEIGLTERDSDGIRLLPDGRRLELIVETSGERTEEVDILQLITDSWRKIGVELFTKPSQLEVLRNRIYAGETVMTASRGVDNGIPTAWMAPTEFAPVAQVQYQWPMWGQYFQTKGNAGEPVDMEKPLRLMTLLETWENATDRDVRVAAWQEMLGIHADEQYTLGLVNAVPQPVIVSADLRNVPAEGLFNYEPGAHFGLYRPDTFWFDR